MLGHKCLIVLWLWQSILTGGRKPHPWGYSVASAECRRPQTIRENNLSTLTPSVSLERGKLCALKANVNDPWKLIKPMLALHRGANEEYLFRPGRIYVRLAV